MGSVRCASFISKHGRINILPQYIANLNLLPNKSCHVLTYNIAGCTVVQILL